MQYTNKLNLPAAIVNAIVNDDYNSGDSDITVTQLIGPIQQFQLQKKYRDKLHEDISDNIYTLIGKSIHAILEKSENVAKVEERLFTEIEGWKFSGQFDRLALITENGGFSGKVQDYKIASVWEYIYGLNEEKIAQVNCLAYLLSLKSYKISQLEIVMIFRDWQKSKARYNQKYPQQQVGIIPVPLWSEATQEKYIHDRIKLFQTAVNPKCTDAETWNKGNKYAVMSEKRKTAHRVCDSKEEAEQWMKDNGKGYSIEFRPGENTRCENYCNVKDFCPQYQANKKQETAA